MLSFDHGDVNLSIGDENYVTTLTARSALGSGRGTYWRKFLVSEYWLTRIRKLPHLEFLKEVERAYEFLLALPEGSLFVEICTVVGTKYIEGATDICAALKPGGLLKIRPEPDNPHDPLAYKVFRLGKPIGYIPHKGGMDVHRTIQLAFNGAKSLSARVIELAEVHGTTSVSILVYREPSAGAADKWYGIEKMSEKEKHAKKLLFSFSCFMDLHRALVACEPCGRIIPASWYSVFPLKGACLAKRPYAGENSKPAFYQNDVFRLVDLPDEATGFAVFTGCCLTYICLCSNHLEASQRLRCVPSFGHHPGTRKLTEKFAAMTVRQYLDGLAMYGLKDGYCYFGHQRGLDGMGECFLGPDGGLDFAYVRCNSRDGFEACCIPPDLMTEW